MRLRLFVLILILSSCKSGEDTGSQTKGCSYSQELSELYRMSDLEKAEKIIRNYENNNAGTFVRNSFKAYLDSVSYTIKDKKIWLGSELGRGEEGVVYEVLERRTKQDPLTKADYIIKVGKESSQSVIEPIVNSSDMDVYRFLISNDETMQYALETKEVVLQKGFFDRKKGIRKKRMAYTLKPGDTKDIVKKQAMCRLLKAVMNAPIDKGCLLDLFPQNIMVAAGEDFLPFVGDALVDHRFKEFEKVCRALQKTYLREYDLKETDLQNCSAVRSVP